MSFYTSDSKRRCARFSKLQLTSRLQLYNFDNFLRRLNCPELLISRFTALTSPVVLHVPGERVFFQLLERPVIENRVVPTNLETSRVFHADLLHYAPVVLRTFVTSQQLKSGASTERRPGKVKTKVNFAATENLLETSALG